MKTLFKFVFALVALYAVIRFGEAWNRRHPASAEANAIAGSTRSAMADGAPFYRVTVLSVTCDDGLGRPFADVSVRNDGATAIEGARAFVGFGGKVRLGRFDADTIGPGSEAAATVSGHDGDTSDCTLVSIQDGDSNAAVLDR